MLFGQRTFGKFVVPSNLRDLSGAELEIIENFHKLYYKLWQEGRGTIDCSYLGWQTWKCPFDLWIYQELLFKLRPDLIVETGSNKGGSALYLADICERLGKGKIISIDTEKKSRPSHTRIQFWTGSSVDPHILSRLRDEVSKAKTVMVVLDSDHSRDHVRKELEEYRHFVTVGSYLIVEDTNVNGHPAAPEHGPGPMEALEDFLKSSPGFKSDPDCERFLLSLNPRGYLKRES